MSKEARETSVIVYQNEPVDMIIVKQTGEIEVSLKQNLYEYGAWVAAKKLVDTGHIAWYDWLLMIHDSCAFQKDTFEKIRELCLTLTFTTIDFYSLVSRGFHNISLVRRHGIYKIADIFSTSPSLTKEEAIKYEGVGGIIKILDEAAISRGEYGIGTQECGKIWFSNGEKIVVRILPINLLKFYKAINAN